MTDLAGLLTRRDSCILGLYFPYILNEYDSDDNVIYEGYHLEHNAATSRADWTIVKRTWAAGTDSPTNTVIEILVGVWDNRATLDWV